MNKCNWILRNAYYIWKRFLISGWDCKIFPWNLSRLGSKCFLVLPKGYPVSYSNTSPEDRSASTLIKLSTTRWNWSSNYTKIKNVCRCCICTGISNIAKYLSKIYPEYIWLCSQYQYSSIYIYIYAEIHSKYD